MYVMENNPPEPVALRDWKSRRWELPLPEMEENVKLIYRADAEMATLGY
jgi:hypothetical protein